MQIEVIKKNDVLPVGTVADVLDETTTEYSVMFCSAFGSFQQDVEKKFCKILKESTK